MARPQARKKRPHRPHPVQPAAPSRQRYIVGGSRVDGPRDWRWKTFPVFFVFAATFFCVSALEAWFFAEGWGLMSALLTLIAAIPLAFAIAHLVTLRYLAPHAPPPRPADEE